MTVRASDSLAATIEGALPRLPSGIYLVCWPAEEVRRRYLDQAKLPRLLLVQPGNAAPRSADCLEDWVLLPASTDEVVARAATLRAHAEAHDRAVPEVEPNGIVTFGSRVTVVSDGDARVLDALLPHFGEPVPVDALIGELTAESDGPDLRRDIPDPRGDAPESRGDGPGSRRVEAMTERAERDATRGRPAPRLADLHAAITRLSTELAPLGLAIEAIGDVGYSLTVDPLGPFDLTDRRPMAIVGPTTG